MSVRLLAAGGTIAMSGRGGAVPALDAGSLAALVPDVQWSAVEQVANKPGPQMTPGDALQLARAAAAAAATGEGVVVTHGTDTLEEVAFLCDLIYDGDTPIVFTGAIRPASAPGADGPANLAGAAHAAASRDTAGLGVLVCFAGELHAARAVRKDDSTSPRAFLSPNGGPIGYVGEHTVRVEARPARRPPLAVHGLDGRVETVVAALGSDGAAVHALLDAGADGLVVVVLGAGHAPPAFMEALRAAAARVPVVACVRPSRGEILHETYGFEGSERDLRASGAICAGALSPAAARIKLLACLGARLDRDGLAAAFAPDDL
ncbi:MAG TPA: asparaginase domain-containing protein [Solirubrobacteraceae bacterium]